MLLPDFVSGRCGAASLASLASVKGESCAPAGPCRVVAESGVEMALCSARDPAGEAARQASAWLDSLRGARPRAVLVLGFGFGWHVEAIAKLLPEGALLVVADPSPSEFTAAAGSFDFSALASCKVELRFAVSSDPDAAAADLKGFLDAKGVAVPSLFIHPACARAFPSRYAVLRKALSKLARERVSDIGTFAALGSEWLLNSVENLPALASLPFIDPLKGSCQGSLAIVACAGPSLDDSIDWIAKASSCCPVICVGTALKSLLARGVEPHFVVAVDSDPKIQAQFEGVAGSFFQLLLPFHMNPPLLSRFPGRTRLFSTPLLPGFNAFLSGGALLPALLQTAGTVAVSAIDFARFLGAKGVVLAGLDLAMASDGRSHSSGSVYDGVRMDKRSLVPLPGNAGETVLTTPQFARYVGLLDTFSLSLKKEGLKLFNVSKGGASLAGADFVESFAAMDAALDEFASCDVRKSLEGRGMEVDVAASDCFRSRLPSAVASLRRISAVCEEALKLCRLMASSSTETSGAILARLESLDKELNSDNLAMGLCDDALRAVSLGLPESGDASTAVLTFYGTLGKASKLLAERLDGAAAKLCEKHNSGD